MQDIINRAKAVMRQPRKFFKSLKESGVKPAFRYFAILSAVQLVLSLVISTSFHIKGTGLGDTFANLSPQASLSFLVLSLALGYVLGLGLSFVWAGILHLYIRLCGGKQIYSKTYQLSTYASTPSLLLGWIPFVGFIASIGSLVLLIVGTQEVHKVSKKKAILMYVIPVALFTVLWLAMLAVFLSIAHTNPEIAKLIAQQ